MSDEHAYTAVHVPLCYQMLLRLALTYVYPFGRMFLAELLVLVIL